MVHRLGRGATYTFSSSTDCVVSYAGFPPEWTLADGLVKPQSPDKDSQGLSLLAPSWDAGSARVHRWDAAGRANKKSFPRGAPMQHVAPRQNPELSNGHLIALD